MDKKVIGIVIAIIVVIVGISTYLLLNSDSKKESSNTTSTSNVTSNTSGNNSNEENDTKPTTSKVLVVYFSAQNHTREVAHKIADNLNADTFEIVPVNKYSSADLDWTDSNSRVTKEHDNESLRDIKLENTKVENWDSYDTILIGYPIWWGIAAWPVNNFVKENDFSGKTVIPFCTSSSSGLGESGRLLEEMAKGGEWQEGIRFSSSPSDSDIKSFTDSIK